MSRLGIISDIHALREALVQIERFGCDAVVCAGDLVDYGVFPEQTLTLLRERRIPCVRGNHDRWAVHGGYDASGWDLTARSVDFLSRLPETWAATIDGVRVVVWHARPGDDLRGLHPDDLRDGRADELLDKAAADVLIVGHTHVAMHVECHRGMIVNPGALLRDPGAPMDLPTPGVFGMLELSIAEVHRSRCPRWRRRRAHRADRNRCEALTANGHIGPEAADCPAAGVAGRATRCSLAPSAPQVA